ncbi:hypothetical protein GCM10010329_77850 [Streptomyces spiroverticillatus]|uniref:Uncharacterized protein n=1 Tax=Streptomyces finlayi TaxID=67296 RepID=A0A918X5D7_9ACTN|nr:hypothetical protein [Streptomyces finlayi]GHA43422.1 hypothetical protein GCM10010329_77850 [Streptomyces spiroverticillatus]GHD13392.1 hypothetical protein GCM10010334_71500 [Streptomyces finlayi]
MASVMGLLEKREAAARVRVEELRVEADRILAELGAAEVVLERRAIARAELGEALASDRDAVVAPVAEAPDPAPVVAGEGQVPVAGSVVRRCGEGMTVQALALDYRRIVELVECGPGGGEGVSAKELAARLGLEVVPAKVETVRSRAKRLVERGWLSASPSGRFMPRQPIAAARRAVGMPGGPVGGS